MEALLDNIHLLAAHNFTGLKKACQVDDEDLADMIAEIKTLNPKPGLQFGAVSVQSVVPDVFVRQKNDGSWHIELNNETLPKVLINKSYYTTVADTAKSTKDKEYIQDCFQTANWLVKSLDQRARTILKVSEEIVRQQDAFLAMVSNIFALLTYVLLPMRLICMNQLLAVSHLINILAPRAVCLSLNISSPQLFLLLTQMT